MRYSIHGKVLLDYSVQVDIKKMKKRENRNEISLQMKIKWKEDDEKRPILL